MKDEISKRQSIHCIQNDCVLKLNSYFPFFTASEKESQQRLKHAGRHLDKLNFDKANSADQDIDKIFSEMLMPPPVSAIYTPKVTKHEGNVARSAPKYFPTVHVSPPPSPIKPLKASPEVIQDKNLL